MKIKDLISVIDPYREYDDQYIEIVNNNGKVDVRFTTSSKIALVVEEWEILSIEATGKGVIKVWLMD